MCTRNLATQSDKEEDGDVEEEEEEDETKRDLLAVPFPSDKVPEEFISFVNGCQELVRDIGKCGDRTPIQLFLDSIPPKEDVADAALFPVRRKRSKRRVRFSAQREIVPRSFFVKKKNYDPRISYHKRRCAKSVLDLKRCLPRYISTGTSASHSIRCKGGKRGPRDKHCQLMVVRGIEDIFPSNFAAKTLQKGCTNWHGMARGHSGYFK